ncbi:MAG: hypothetical protein K2L50_07045, partial [Bacteroidales bacterium]|nr:hypothetical protein [Bacteroidales bacterium]
NKTVESCPRSSRTSGRRRVFLFRPVEHIKLSFDKPMHLVSGVVGVAAVVSVLFWVHQIIVNHFDFQLFLFSQ